MKTAAVNIDSASKGAFPDLAEAFRYRGLLAAFVRRNLAVRYRQAGIGVLWAFLQPALVVGILTLVFNRVVNLPSDDLPYSVFAASGVVLWQYAAKILSDGANSLVANQHMLTKIYFPRILLPTASACDSVVDFSIACLIVAGLAIYHGVALSPLAILAPLFVALAVAFALGITYLFAALNVRFRDVRIALPFLIQIGFFATPIMFSPTLLPASWRWLLACNPMAVAIDGMRWSLFGSTGTLIGPLEIGIALLVCAAALVGGLFYFGCAERRFADVI